MRLFRLSYQADHKGPAPNERIFIGPNVTATVWVFEYAIRPMSLSLSSGENPTSTLIFIIIYHNDNLKKEEAPFA